MSWRHREGLDHLLRAIGGTDGTTRYVGGCVRDSLIGEEVVDVDMATLLPPDMVMDRLQLAGIKAVPTGLAHGTVTAVVHSRPYEITTLRSDVETDGRRARVAFSDDWREDAQRRDFTINALYADPVSGEISDYFGGLDDLAARRVRFIGDAEQRIAEDHLRILRYFRFFARFGGGEMDAEAYRACRTHARSLMALSRERIADEMIKLLGLPDPVTALSAMLDGGIFAAFMPEATPEGLRLLMEVRERELASGTPPSALLRLCALLDKNPRAVADVTARLKFSNKVKKRVACALQPPPYRTVRELAFRVGAESARDIILLDPSCDPAVLSQIEGWEQPQFPVGGATLIALGMTPGPAIARLLNEIRECWIDEGFPDPVRTREIAVQIVSKFQRENQ